MDTECVYRPEFNILADAYLGSKEKILYNYLCYTYDRIKSEEKIVLDKDGASMCFNTGLLTETPGKIPYRA